MEWMLLRLGLYAVLQATLAGPTVPPTKGTDFFEAKIRPVRVEHCYKCHSTQAKSSGAACTSTPADALAPGRDGGDR